MGAQRDPRAAGRDAGRPLMASRKFAAPSRYFWIAISVFGVSFALLDAVHGPAPSLFAAMLGAGTYAVLADIAVEVPSTLRTIGMATVGVTAGANIDASVVDMVLARPVAVLSGVFSTIVLTLVIGQLLRLSPGMSGTTAAFASIAGGASGVSMMARDFGADEGVVLLIQYLRVVIVLVTVPIVSPFLAGGGDGGEGAAHLASGPTDYAFFFIAGAVGFAGSRVLRFTASDILMPLLAASALSVSGVFGAISVPPVLVGIGYAILGLSVGAGFTLQRLRSVMRHLPIAIAQIFLGIAACAAAGILFAETVGVTWLDGYLATSPGGLAAVIAVAIDSDSEVGLILTMQFVRVFVALLAAPLIGLAIRKFSGRGAPGTSPIV